MQNYDDETVKHQKKRQSSTSKAKFKAKHKHLYKECLLIKNDIPYVGTYCELCGKLYNVISPSENRRSLTSEEIFTKYGDLKRFELENFGQQYLVIERTEDNE